MKKKPKIKKGSSLVAVILVFCILTILGTSMLSLTLASYKRRSAETKIKSNLYASESGLAEAYSIIGKYVDKAYEVGNEDAQNELAILLDAEKEKVGKGLSSNYIDTDGNIITTEIEKFESDKLTSAYEAYMINSLTKDVSDDSKGKLKKDLETLQNYTSLKDKDGLPITPMINVIEDKSDDDFKKDKDEVEKCNLVLESTFNLDDFEKTIQARYVIKVPAYSSTNKLIRITKNPVWAKAICADKDMKIQNGPVNIKGDIYIKGNDLTDNNKDVGIILESAKSKLIVTGDVATAENLETKYKSSSTETGSEIVVNGNIYAKNVITSNGANGSSISTNRSALPDEKSDGSIYVMDDMEVNAKKSTVNIKGGFYGVSDGSVSTGNAPDNSSSIIVNTADMGSGSAIKIAGPAYIAGSAYISGLKDGSIKDYKYQTGESVAIKGNYRAYTQPLKNDLKLSENKTISKDDVKFKYYDPLDLASEYKDGEKYNEFSIIDKSKYFEAYYNDYALDSGLNLGEGIKIGDPVNSIYMGSIFSKKDKDKPIFPSNYLIDEEGKVKTKRNKLKNQLFHMGFYNEFEGNASIEDIPDRNPIIDTKPTPQITVASQVNFKSDVFKNTTENGIEVKEGKKYIKESKEIIVLNGDENIYYEPSENDTTSKGIIITEGDLYLSGNINFTGTIICGGTIYFTDDKEKTFNYDEAYLNDVISKNYSIFKDVFKKPLSSENDVYVNVVEGERNLVKSSMIEMTDWVIIK